LMDETDPWQYVVSHNLHRRHLTTAQRAMVADKLASLKQGEKKPDSGIPLSQPTQAEAATMLNVSVDSVKQARKIRKTATHETVAAVERGEITLNAAVATVKPRDIASEVAAECGVSRDQIIRDGEYAEAVDIVSQTDPEIQAKVRSGKVTQDDVIAAAKAAKPKEATRANAEPEMEKKSPTVTQIQRSLFKMGADKKRHKQLIQIAGEAVHRMPVEHRIEFLASTVVWLGEDEQRLLRDAVREKQDALDAEAESYGQ
jgi:hypothetical protein